MRQCHKDDLLHLAALALFSCPRPRREVNLVRGTALLLKTKTSTNVQKDFSKEVSARLAALKGDAQPADRVFCYSAGQAVNAWIRAVCARAGINCKSSHVCGRHTFATTAIGLGMDIRSTIVAGGWRSVEFFLGTYVHPSANAGRIVADTLDQYQFDADL